MRVSMISSETWAVRDAHWGLQEGHLDSKKVSRLRKKLCKDSCSAFDIPWDRQRHLEIAHWTPGGMTIYLGPVFVVFRCVSPDFPSTSREPQHVMWRNLHEISGKMLANLPLLCLSDAHQGVILENVLPETPHSGHASDPNDQLATSMMIVEYVLFAPCFYGIRRFEMFLCLWHAEDSRNDASANLGLTHTPNARMIVSM